MRDICLEGECARLGVSSTKPHALRQHQRQKHKSVDEQQTPLGRARALKRKHDEEEEERQRQVRVRLAEETDNYSIEPEPPKVCPLVNVHESEIESVSGPPLGLQSRY